MTQYPALPSSQATWARVLGELNTLIDQKRPHPYDLVRHEKMQGVFRVTGRPLVVYAVACTQPNKILPPQVLQMDFSDKVPFNDMTEHLPRAGVDVMLHSPGGFAEAAEALVDLLRSRFDNITFIIPTFAKSAATMLAMSGDQILMSDQAELGPTDPQMNTSQGVSPAQAVIDQFEKAKAEITQNPAGLPAWAPILAQMGPSLLQQCQNAITLSRELVKRWLAGYMFTGEADAEQKAEVISEYLANHNNFMSHARGIRLTKLEELGVKALPFPDELVAPLWDLDCAVDITLGNTNVVRIIENHLGNRMLRNFGQVTVPGLQLIPQTPPQVPPTPPVPTGSRPDRRRQKLGR